MKSSCRYASKSKTSWVMLLFLFCLFRTQAQSKVKTGNNIYQMQVGVSLKATLEFAFIKQRPNPILRLSADAGIGSVFINSWLYPSLNEEFEWYNGGLGSSNRGPFLSHFGLDAITALTVTFGWPAVFSARGTDLTNRNIPLYYFSDFVHPALQNPFNYSMSIGTNIILTTDKGKKDQRVGFINLHADRFQLCYYNDGGTPMQQTYLGDRSDRYYTGGGILALDLPRSAAISSLTLAYFKFTGYTINAFELSNQLYLSYMNYHDVSQKYYNKSVWSFTASSLKAGVDMSVKSYNSIKLDMQDYIHSAIFNTFHVVPYPAYIAFSAGYLYSMTQIGLP
jgi:Bacterial toxin 23